MMEDGKFGVLSITAEPKKSKLGLGVSMNIYSDRRIIDCLDEESQDRFKELTDEIGALLAEGVTLLIEKTTNDAKDLSSEFMEYVKKKAATNSDAADVYNMLKNGKW